jgi:hypothetical protein
VKGKVIAAVDTCTRWKSRKKWTFHAPGAKHDLIKAVFQSTINWRWGARTFEITSLPKPCKLLTFKLHINHNPHHREPTHAHCGTTCQLQRPWIECRARLYSLTFAIILLWLSLERIILDQPEEQLKKAGVQVFDSRQMAWISFSRAVSRPALVSHPVSNGTLTWTVCWCWECVEFCSHALYARS